MKKLCNKVIYFKTMQKKVFHKEKNEKKLP